MWEALSFAGRLDFAGFYNTNRKFPSYLSNFIVVFVKIFNCICIKVWEALSFGGRLDFAGLYNTKMGLQFWYLICICLDFELHLSKYWIVFVFFLVGGRTLQGCITPRWVWILPTDNSNCICLEFEFYLSKYFYLFWKVFV